MEKSDVTKLEQFTYVLLLYIMLYKNDMTNFTQVVKFLVRSTPRTNLIDK